MSIGSAFAGEFVVIVNKNNAVSSISSSELKRVYTGKQSDLGGQKVVPVNQDLVSDIGKSFLNKIVGLAPEEYQEYWIAQQVKGLGSAPMVQKMSVGVVAIISQLPGGIGYVEADKVTADVKVITVK
jgi:ABC-type phosphate transport system substrate-binding protein